MFSLVYIARGLILILLTVSLPEFYSDKEEKFYIHTTLQLIRRESKTLRLHQGRPTLK